MIDQVESLGREVEALWGKEGYAREAFPEIARRALEASGIHRRFSLEEFLHTFWKTKELPQQLDMNNGFGEPPITLYRTKNFFMDLYFWIAPEVSIHTHEFEGVFTPLLGKSLCSAYEFLVKDRDGDEVLIGDLRLKRAVLLKEGEVQEIIPGLSYIHQVLHLTCPTVSFVIRTFGARSKALTFLKPHLAFVLNEGWRSVVEKKQLDTLTMLHRLKHPLSDPFLEEFILKMDPSWAISFLIKYFEETVDLDQVERILGKISKARKWAPYLLDRLRQKYQMGIDWTQIQEEGERFFVALLSTLSERDEVMRLIHAYQPGKPAEVSMMEWLRRLIRRKAVGLDLNETGLEVLELLLHGHEEEALCQTLAARYKVKNSEAFRQEIRGFCHQLRSLELLKALIPTNDLSCLRT